MSKQIAWESWNAREEEILLQREEQTKSILNSIANEGIQPGFSEDEMYNDGESTAEIKIVSQPIVTPFGVTIPNSPFKPSERWKCWIGNTNFKVTHEVAEILNNMEGVEALSILGTYTFCIGIAKLFESTEVTKNIELALIGEYNGSNESDDGGSLE